MRQFFVPFVVAISLGFGTVATTSSAAAEFEASSTGSVSGSALTSQVFRTESGGAAIECSQASVGGSVTETKSPYLGLGIAYGECSAFGFPATISEADFTLAALTETTGSAAVKNSFTIKVPIVGCTITVGVAGNSDLADVNFKVNFTKLIVEFALAKITITVSGGGGLCGKEGTYTTGSYVGKIEVNLLTGSIKVS